MLHNFSVNQLDLLTNRKQMKWSILKRQTSRRFLNLK